LSLAISDEEDDFDIDEIKTDIIYESGNILLNAIIGSISNLTKESVEYAPPQYKDITLNNMLESMKIDSNNGVILTVENTFSIKSKSIKGSIIILFDNESVNKIIQSEKSYHNNGS